MGQLKTSVNRWTSKLKLAKPYSFENVGDFVQDEGSDDEFEFEFGLME